MTATAPNGAAPHRRLAPAAGLLLALVGLAPAPAQAQIENYISNLRSSSRTNAITGITTGRALSQAFETGSRSGGYPLSEVVLELGNIDTGTIKVTIRENSVVAGSNVPGDTALYTLSNPASLRSGNNTFTAPTGATLAADTVYHIVAESTSGVPARWHRLLRSGAQIDNAGGWDIDFTYLSRLSGDPWEDDGSIWALSAAVRGEVPEPPTVSVARVASPVEEGEDAQFTVTRTVTTAGALTVNYRVSEDGAMVAAGEEGAKTVAFADGDTEKTVTVPTVEDTGHEADSVVTLTLTADADYDLGTDDTATVTVEDDDNANPTGEPTIDDTTPVIGQTLTADASGIDDPDGLTGATFTWQWIRVSGGTDTRIPGATSKTYTVVADDVGATLKVEASFTDDDGTPQTVESEETKTAALLMLSIADANVAEGDSGNVELEFTVTLNGATTETVTVDWATVDGTATAGKDYTAGNGTLTFNTGDSSKTLTVTVLDDTVHEPIESFTVRLSNPSGATIADGSATGSILQNDDQPTVTLVLTPASISENGAVSTVTASLGNPSSGPTFVRVSVAPVSPAVAGDYRLSSNRELIIPAEETDSTGVVTITAVNNSVYEGDKTVTVSATVRNTGGITAPQDVELTIEEDEAPPGLSIGDASVDEGDSGSTTMTFTVRLSSATSGQVTVDWATSDGTATAGTDYTAGDGSLTFNAGDSSKTVSVTVTGDDVDEPNETFTVTLSSASGADISDGTATGTITDDDDAPTVTLGLSPASISENGAVSTVTATLDHASSEETTVTVSVAPVSPAVAGDYTLSTNRALTIAAGSTTSTGTVTMTAVDNSVYEGDKTVTVSGTATNTQGITAPQNVTLTIEEDEAAPLPRMSVARVASSVEEGEDAQFTVTRTGVTASALTVNYSVSESGAMVAAGDEGAKSVAFADGDTEQTVTVPTEEDTGHEADSTVTLTLTADAAYDLGTDATAEVTVEDDDNAAPTGVPAIDDTTPVVGETLTARAAGIVDDPDGLTGATFTWQWFRKPSGGTETEIAGATSATYTVVAADVGATLKAQVSFTDDDGTAETRESAETATAALPMLSIGDASVDEGDSGSTTMAFTVTLSQAATEAVTVNWTTQGGATATAGTDYTAGNGTLTFNAGDSSKTVSVSVTGDNVDEPDEETFTVTLSSPSGATISDGTATGTIRDDDDTPTVTLVLTPASISENGAVGTVTATLDHPSSEATTVMVSASPVSPAVAGDYTLSGNLDLTIAAGETDSTGVVTITAVNNNVHEGDKMVTVSGTATNSQGITAPQSVSLTITDDELPPGLSIADASVDEGDSGSTTLTFTVTLNPVALSPVTVDWATADGTARAGTDYTAGSGSLTFNAGDSSKTVSVSVTGDDVDEPDETFTVTLSSASGAAISDGTATGTITDDDDEPTVTLVLSSNSITEVNQQSTVTARLDHPSSEETTVTVSVAPVSPAVAGDYTLSMNRALTIPAGRTTSTGTVTVTSVNNTVDAPHKTVTVSATATNSLGVTDPDDVTLTIRDNDATPTVTLVLTPASIPEAGGTSTVTATLNHPSSEATTVTVSASPVSPAVAGDYTLSGNLDLTIAAGATTSTGTVTITAVDNDMVAAAKEVTVSATATNGHGVTAPDDVTLAIRDDDMPGLSVADASVAEGDSGGTTMTFMVMLNPAAVSPVTVDWATADGTARAGTDYTAGSGSLTFNVGDSTRTVSVTVTGDDVDEPDETFTVTLSSASGATIADAEATGTIRDDDDEPTVTLVLTPASILESRNQQSTVTATLDHASSEETTVTVSVAPVSPAVAGDYTLSSNRVLTIAAGATTSTGTVTVTSVNNVVDAPDKTVTVSGTATNSLGVTAPDDVTLTIRDNDATPTVTLVLSPASIPEAGGTSTVTATLDHPSSEATTVTVSASPVSPAVAGDYTLSGNLDLTIAAGSTTSTGTVTITAVDNNVHAGNKTVTVSGTATNSQGITAPQSVSLTITDDEGPPGLSIADASVAEGDSGGTTMTFTVTLNPTTSGQVTVDWATADGTARAGTDYTAGNGSLTFNAGDSTRTVSVTVTGDDVDEPNETFTVTLSSASGADISDAEATGTIRDDDDTPTVTLVLSPDSITEVNQQSTVTATLDHPSSEATTVTVSVAPVSPAVAGDYRLSTNRVLTIAAGQTASTGTVTITAVNNTVDAPHKTVTVSGTATNSQGVTAPDAVTLTIRDNDATPTVTLVLSPASIPEAGGRSTVTATLNHPSSEATTVTVSVSPVSPAVMADYMLSSGRQLTIAAGATTSTGTVTITGVDNDMVAAAKEVTVSGTATNRQGVTAPGDVTLAIRDDDVPGLSVADASVAEGDSGSTTMTFTVMLNPVAVSPVTVDWATADGTARAGTDYTAGNGSLTFGPGENRKTVTVTVTGDDVDEPNETLTVRLSNASGASLGDATGTGTIRDDDAEPTVTLVLTPDSIDENGGTSTVTARLDRPSSEATTVTVSVSPVSPAVSGDYRLSSSRELTIAAGATASTGTVTVTGVDNAVDAPHKTVTVSGTATNAQGVTDPGDVTLTITDDEAAMVTVAAETETVPEGDDAVFILTRTGVVSDELAVTFEVTGGDTVLTHKPPPTGVTFQANEDTARVTLATEDDDTDEPDAMLTLTLDDGGAYDLGTPSRAVVTVQDDEAPPTVSISSADDGSTKDEGAPFTFVVELSRQSAVPVTVKYTLTRTAVMAGDGGDAGGSVTGMTTSFALGVVEGDVTIPAGETRKEVSLETNDDRYSPSGDTIEITLQAGAGYVLDTSSPSSPTVMVEVRDNEKAPTVSIIADPESRGTVTEGDDLVFVVSLSHPSAVEITVDYTLEVTAEAENNYEGPATGGTVTFDPDAPAPHNTVQEISVKTVNDGIVEQEGGMVVVELTGSNVATLDPDPDRSVATGTIQDDARLPVVTVAAVSGQIREGEEAKFELTRTGDTSAELKVMLEVSEQGGDMVPDTLEEEPQEVTFEKNYRTASFAVEIANDNSTESDSELTVTVLRGDGYQVQPADAPRSSATVTVADAGEVSVLAQGHRAGAGALLRRHVQRFSQLTSDAALGRLDGDPRASTVDVDVGDGGVSANGDVAVALPSGWDGWASVRYSKLDGSADGSVWDVYAGADRIGADGRTAYGALLGYEPGRVTAEGVRLEAEHVQLGLYGAHRLSETLTVDGAVGWGRGKGDLSLVEGAPVTASYRSERIAVRGDLTGDFGWGGEGLRVEPQIGLLYAEEGLDAFTDSVGGEGPEERLWLARLGLGPKVTWHLGEGTMHGKLRVNLDAHNLESDEGRTEEVSASLELGHRWRIDKGSSLDLSVDFDGVGSGWFSSGTVGLRYEARF